MSIPSEIISGHTIAFDHGIAIACGINAAIVYNHIIFWLKVNKDKPESQHEGRTWMYQTQERMADFFEFFDEREVKYCIKKLIDVGLLEKKNFNKNHFDHTNWYSLPEPVYQKVFTKVQKRTHRSDKNATIEGDQIVPSEGVNFVPSTYIEDKEKTKNAGLAGSESPETIYYQGRNAKPMSITRSDIHKHFLGKLLSPMAIDAAIDKFRARKGEVGDVFKLLEIILGEIKNSKTKEEEPKKSTYTPLKNPMRINPKTMKLEKVE